MRRCFEPNTGIWQKPTPASANSLSACTTKSACTPLWVMCRQRSWSNTEEPCNEVHFIPRPCPPTPGPLFTPLRSIPLPIYRTIYHEQAMVGDPRQPALGRVRLGPELAALF